MMGVVVGRRPGKAAWMGKPCWTLGTTAPNVVIVEIPVKAGGGDHWFLLRGDVHWDNPHCDRALEMKHLRQAQERGAGIIDVGDLFCAMQGKYDKRADKSCVRPEHQAGDYLDALVRTATDYYAPFAGNFVVIGQGNHETAIRKRHETDLTERLVSALKDRTGAGLRRGGYTGWVVFRFKYHTRMASVKLWYCHGYGGGGPVTVDNIQAQRQVAYVRDADIMVSGHTHDRWSRDFVTIGLNQQHIPEQRKIEYVKTATYKDEYAGGEGGWHIETGKPPKPKGAMWLRLMPCTEKHGLRVAWETTRAS